jgi:hypothetical protein
LQKSLLALGAGKENKAIAPNNVGVRTVEISTMNVCKRQRFQLKGVWQLVALALMCLAVGLLYVALFPWAFFMGGKLHALPDWDGWGRRHSKTAGDYFLYVSIYPETHSTGALIPGTPVKGDAYLCTPKGERFYLKLGGGMRAHISVNTVGEPINFYMRNWRETFPVNADNRPSLDFAGTWGDSKLVMDDCKTLSAAFLPDGTLRPNGSHVLPSETEDIQFTLREGTYWEFKAACPRQ